MPAAEAGLVAVHIRRGPWGYLQRGAARAQIRVDSLDELPEALRVPELRVGLGVDAHALEPTACRSCSAAFASSIRAGSPATRTATWSRTR